MEWIVVGSIAFVIGVVITLRFMGGRPINVNVSAHAEAQGGSATTSTTAAPSSAPSPLMGLIKLAIIAVLVLTVVITLGSTLAKLGEKPSVVVNVPTQEAPKIVIPETRAPEIRVVPQPVTVTAPTSVFETAVLALVGFVSILTTIISFVAFRKLRSPAPVAPSPPTEYVRTSYGWTPKRVDPEQTELVEEFFGQAKKR